MQPKVLHIDSVQLSFGDRKILQDIAISCFQGEIIGLLGRNGSGKSSLLKIIFGSLRPSYRYVSINGRVISNGYADGSIAYLPQHNYFPFHIKISSITRMLVDKCFWDEFAESPFFKKHQHKTTEELAGGERRILEILMIVYSKAPFILLDEPFTHISPVQTEIMKPIIKQCALQKGIIITDHLYQNVLDITDRLIIIENGCAKAVKDNDDLVTYKYLSGGKIISDPNVET